MSREKQIEEMAEDMCSCCKEALAQECEYSICECVRKHAEALYNAGYRKQVGNANFATTTGEWEKRTFVIFDSEKVGYRCSECNTTWDISTNYCPNCGAKMKGGAE